MLSKQENFLTRMFSLVSSSSSISWSRFFSILFSLVLQANVLKHRKRWTKEGNGAMFYERLKRWNANCWCSVVCEPPSRALFFFIYRASFSEHSLNLIINDIRVKVKGKREISVKASLNIPSIGVVWNWKHRKSQIWSETLFFRV